MSVNGVYIVVGEANSVIALLNKARRQYQHSHQPPSLEDTDPLLRGFIDLKEALNRVSDLNDVSPTEFLSPFLEVIKAQNTNGPITESALSAVAKFLSYGLIDASSIKASTAVESVSHAVVHTKFIGGKDRSSDECVLYKILHVLRALLLSPCGSLLSNEAVCDLMQSCFRIVFEKDLSHLLRKSAKTTLCDMTQLIFTRLPTFREDTRHPYIRKLVMSSATDLKKKKKKRVDPSLAIDDSEDGDSDIAQPLSPIRKESSDVSETGTAASKMGYDVVSSFAEPVNVNESSNTPLLPSAIAEEKADEAGSESDGGSKQPSKEEAHRNVSFRRNNQEVETEQRLSKMAQMPYGLPCCRELLRFLIALTNPMDRHNTESMVALGLGLIIVALEASADHLASYSFLMPLIRDHLCRSVLQLLDTEKLPIFAAANRVCFLLFESMRRQLKFQLESYFHKLKSVVLSEQRNTSYEQKEMALESIVQLWRIPGLVTEIYLNYDCDLYCTNLFEDLTKLLVDMSFPVIGVRPAFERSLEALLVVIENIDQHCICLRNGKNLFEIHESDNSAQSLALPILSGFESARKVTDVVPDVQQNTDPSLVLLRANRHATAESSLPPMSEVFAQKKRKTIFAEGTDLFNQDPRKGIEFLREKGLLGNEPSSVVSWLRTNPQLDKKKIADYICSRKHADVLSAFVKSFPFENTRLDVALRMFLESFRLPGEAAEISMVMQHFSDQWYVANNAPFNHADAPFTLSYAVIMLNMDQHNPQVRRNQPTMTVDCFKRNLSGTNGGENFESEMLEAMYNAIRDEEIVMPAEQTGLVKENYLWKVLLRRGETNEGIFLHAPTGWNDHDLFSITWGPAIAALSYAFDKTDDNRVLKNALNGYCTCASIAAHYGMSDVFDNLVIHLCKFSSLSHSRDVGTDDEVNRQRSVREHIVPTTPEEIAISFGENKKAQEATSVLFSLVQKNGDILREGWRNLLDVLLYLFRANLLPPAMTEVDDFVDEKGWVSIVRQHKKDLRSTRSETGLLSWFGLGGSAAESTGHRITPQQEELINSARNKIVECCPSFLTNESKYLTDTALLEFMNALCSASARLVDQDQSSASKNSLSGENEDAVIFFLELMISATLENKDRLEKIWSVVRKHLEWLLSPRFGRCPILVERAVVGLLRVANRNLFRDADVDNAVLQSLSLLLRLSPKALFVFSRQIAFGLHELLSTNAANVHGKDDWTILFQLMEAAGAASLPDDYLVTHGRNSFSDGDEVHDIRTVSDRGYTSDNPQSRRNLDYSTENISRSGSSVSVNRSLEWIHLDHKDAAKATQDALRDICGEDKSFSMGSLVLRTNLGRHEPAAFLKVCESISFLLRDAAHITPENFDSSVQCLRTLMEASLDGGRYAAGPLSGDTQNRLHSSTGRSTGRSKHLVKTGKKELSTDVVEDDDVRKEEQELSSNYVQASLLMLDLCASLLRLAPGILSRWAAANPASDTSVTVMWNRVWRPLLQCMARLGCDCRRKIRGAALQCLPRALLPENMSKLGPAEWESCFGEVLFPLLTKLLEPFSAMDPIGMEDTRVRAIQIVAKTLLNHLSELSSLPSFPGLWLRLLDFMELYLRIDSCGNLNEAVPESLKNMVLVLDNTGLFESIPGLHHMTTTKMGNVLPQLIRDLLPPLKEKSGSSNLVIDSASFASVAPKSGRLHILPSVPSSDDNLNSGFINQSTEVSPAVDVIPDRNASTSILHYPPAPVEVPLTEVVVHSPATSPGPESPLEQKRTLEHSQHLVHAAASVPYSSTGQYSDENTSYVTSPQADQYAQYQQYLQYQNYLQQQHAAHVYQNSLASSSQFAQAHPQYLQHQQYTIPGEVPLAMAPNQSYNSTYATPVPLQPVFVHQPSSAHFQAQQGSDSQPLHTSMNTGDHQLETNMNSAFNVVNTVSANNPPSDR